MVAQVNKWQTADGKLFDNHDEAVLHELGVANLRKLQVKLHSAIGHRYAQHDVDRISHMLSNHADEIVESLIPYVVKENV